MKVSLSWIKDYVPVNMPAQELADALTMAGLEVEGLTDRYDYLEAVVVGRVDSVTAHPNADKLKCCQVDMGKRKVGVVCGAPNVAPGMLAALALPGATLPDGTTIEKAVIRGEASEGMLCSMGELLLGEDRSGIMELDAALPVGERLNTALKLSDPVFEIGLTPNRPDCLGVIGVAREVAAIQQVAMRKPEIKLPSGKGDISKRSSVAIKAPDHCPRYAARMVLNVTVKPSPFWLQDKLISVGARPISNLVDITNYIMLETGQPLHAFDFDRLEEGRIVVRTAGKDEEFTTLDDKEHRLDEEVLMICDGAKPVAIGGVMGGLNSEIQKNTRNVLIESAYFSPVSIRKTAKKLGLNTDASHRFERGVDPRGTLYALDRAAQLMAELGEGQLVNGTLDECHELPETPPVSLSISATNRLLGTTLTMDEVTDFLNLIEFETQKTDDDHIRVIPPSFRVDVSRPADLMEEVARLSGYDRIPITFPEIPAEAAPSDKLQIHRKKIRTLLTGLGFNETINYSFIHPDFCDRLRLAENDQRRQPIPILNPLTEDQAVMRTAMIPGLLETLNRNIAQRIRTVRIFESGRIFINQGKDRLPEEIETITGLWHGMRQEKSWHTPDVPCDFYDIKGVVEALLEGLKIRGVQYTAITDSQHPYLKRGNAARIVVNDKPLGIVGEMAHEVLENFSIPHGVFLFELDITHLSPLIPEIETYRPLPKFPETARDVTLIVDRQTEAATIISTVHDFNEKLVEELQLFDIFQGQPIPAGKKSVSFRITYRSADGTLKDELVNELHKNITAKLLKRFNADLPV